MTHKTKSAPSLNVVFLIVAVVLVFGSLIAQSLKVSQPSKEMSAEQKPLPKQTLNQGGHKSTVLSFLPSSSEAEPIKKNVGDAFSLEMVIDPGQNLVSFVKVEILYDPKKLEPIKHEAFQTQGALASILDGPIYTKGKITATMSIGADPTKAIGKLEKSAIVTFKAIGLTTDGAMTQVSFGPGTNILSLASQDSASENVLANSIPAEISIVKK